MDLVDKIIAYESGELDVEGIVGLFAELVKTGQAWTLQGSYGRMARDLINGGYIDKLGNILERGE
jgi:hypothetical protein